MRKLSHKEIVERQTIKQKQGPLAFCVVLNNIRSLHNVGSIFRTCDGVGVQKLWLCGITGYPPQSQILKTALGAEQRVDWAYEEDIVSLVSKLKKKGYQIVLLEQTKESILYQDFEPQAPVALVVGNEIEGISEAVLNLSDQAIEIEMAGMKNSLNVSVALGVVAYHIRNCLIKKECCLGHSIDKEAL